MGRPITEKYEKKQNYINMSYCVVVCSFRIVSLQKKMAQRNITYCKILEKPV